MLKKIIFFLLVFGFLVAILPSTMSSTAIIIMFWVVVMLNVLDVHSTYIGLMKIGWVARSPVLAKMITKNGFWPAIMSVKLPLLFLLAILLIVLIAFNFTATGFAMLATIAAYYLCVVIYNYMQIIMFFQQESGG